MDTVTYPHPTVREELEGWVLESVDASAFPTLAKKLGVQAVPVAVALSPDGRVLARKPNFVEPDAFLAWLREIRRDQVPSR